MAGTALMCCGQALAVDATWSGAVDGNFLNGANWTGGAVPDGTATFTGTPPQTSLSNVELGSSFGGFSFGGTTGPYSFSGVSGNFSGAGIVNADPYVPGLDVAASATLGFLDSASAGNAALNATAAGSSLVFGGASSGGTAAVTLGASSTLDISSHASGISLGALNGAAGSQVLLGDNRLTLNGSGTFAGAASGNGGLTVAAGTVVLTGANSYMGQTVITPGATLRIGDGGTTGTLPGGIVRMLSIATGLETYYTGSVVNHGTLVFNRSDSYSGPGYTYSAGGPPTLDTYEGFLGNITGSGALRIESGDLRTGSIRQGSIYIAPGASLAAMPLAGNMINEGVLTIFSPQTGTSPASGTFNGTITGSGSIVVLDRLLFSFQGTTSIGGSLTLGQFSNVSLIGDQAFGGGVILGSRAVLNIGGSQGAAGRLTGNLTLGANSRVSFYQRGSVGSYAGNITGQGSVYVFGGGVLTFTGTATHSGGTFVGNDSAWFNISPKPASAFDASILRVGDGGTFGSIAGDIGVNGTVAFYRSDNVTYGGVISGPGQVSQIGAGTLTLSGMNTYTGATTVAAGTLSVTGSIASSSGVTVMPGATLSGTGTLPSVAIQSGGTFAPGNSVGTATVSGNLALASGSTTAIEVQGATADRINVSGTASLNGTLKLIPLGGGYAFNTSYTLISAQTGRSGTFASVSTQGSFGAGIMSEVGYTANAVNLTLAPVQLLPAPDTPSSTVTAPGLVGFLPENLRNVGSALDAVRAAGGNLQPFFNVYNAPANQIGNAVNQLSGEASTTTTAMGLIAGQQFLSSMLNPFSFGRSTLLGSRIASNGSADGDDGQDMPVPPRPRYAMWGQATGGYSQVQGEASAGSATRTARGAGFAAGLDIALGTQSMVGFAAGAGETSASLSGGLGRANSWTGQLGIFGRTRLDTRAGGFTLEGAAAVSFLQTDTKRTQYFLNNAEQRASYDARVYSFRLEGRHDGLRRSGITLQPLLAIQAQVVDSDGFTEHSTAPGTPTGVTVRSATNSTVRTELGAQAEGATVVSGREVRGFARVAWGHYLMREQSSATALTAFPAQGFTVLGARPDADSAILAAGIETQIAPRWRLGARVDSELSSRVRDVAGTLRLRYSF